jgi:hypothetical protein
MVNFEISDFEASILTEDKYVIKMSFKDIVLPKQNYFLLFSG